MFKWLNKNAKVSYSQSGEDLIVNFIFKAVGITKPNYLDIGAHHPTHISNTYYFYKEGSQGVCVEPDPDLFQEITKKRGKDVCLNIGIAAGQGTIANFYVMTTKSLNTFSEDEAIRCQRTNNFGAQEIEKIIKIRLMNVNTVIDQYLPNGVNFVSIDVEGLDYEIIKSFDFDKYQPEVFCIETLSYLDNGMLKKNDELIQFMSDKNYYIYADTYMNTIFISNKIKILLNAT